MGCALAAFSVCTRMNSGAHNSNQSLDYSDLVIGTWEGRDQVSAMYLTFKTDGTAIVDYTPNGGEKHELSYGFKDDKTIEISLYPENLIIKKWSDDEISFQPEGKNLREDIPKVYVYRFKRVKPHAVLTSPDEAANHFRVAVERDEKD
jgi:hypothetical protein